MKSGAALKIAATLSPWLLLIPLLGCRSQWPCNSDSNPYGYTANDGATLDPYAQPYLQPSQPLNIPPASTQPALSPGNWTPQPGPSAQPYQPPQLQVPQPLNSGAGSGTINPFSSGRTAPANPYGSINPSGGGFNTNTTIP